MYAPDDYPTRETIQEDFGDRAERTTRQMMTFVLCAILFLTVGALATVNAIMLSKIDSQAARIQSVEANARTAWGKVFDMQEAMDEGCPKNLQ